MDIYDAVEVLKVRLKSAAPMFTDAELEQAVSTAQMETGWALPVTTAFRTYWLMQRAVRHSIHMLCVDSAHKFKFKQINLQHRFEHYNKMIQQFDAAFDKAKIDNAEEFMDALDNLTPDEKIAMFGSYHAPTFQHPAR